VRGEDASGGMESADADRSTDGRVTPPDSAPTCTNPNPQGCQLSEECPPGEECSFEPRHGCAPSACSCDAGEWNCTPDCGGGICAVPMSQCQGPNPAGCTSRGCGFQQVCDVGAGGCVPSNCECDGDGNWLCSGDCEGGVCVREARVCTTDADCAFGNEWCENGTCVYCDNPPVCDIACPEGERRPRRNGCQPCECKPYTLHWFIGCPDQACDGHDGRRGLDPCTNEQAGAECGEEFDRCDPGDECNRMLMCREDDPALTGECEGE